MLTSEKINKSLFTAKVNLNKSTETSQILNCQTKPKGLTLWTEANARPVYSNGAAFVWLFIKFLWTEKHGNESLKGTVSSILIVHPNAPANILSSIGSVHVLSNLFPSKLYPLFSHLINHSIVSLTIPLGDLAFFSAYHTVAWPQMLTKQENGWDGPFFL